MPFKTGTEYASRHNKKLHGKAARGAKDVFNKALASGKGEGYAFRVANAVGDRIKSREDRAKTRYG